jgi:hypothetical protein
MSRGRIWTASDTAEMSVLTGRGWSAARIAKKLGFATVTVQKRRKYLDLQHARSKRYFPLAYEIPVRPAFNHGNFS